MSLSADPASFCFLTEAERVNLAEPGGLAKPRLTLPLEAMLVANLVTWGGVIIGSVAVLCEIEEGGGCVARARPLGVSTLGLWILES
jgi:hypothetical protein